MTMAEHVGYGLQRMTLMKHAGGKAMSKGMCALTGELEACDAKMTLYDSRKRAGMSQRVIGCPAGQKNMRGGMGRAGVLQVI